MNKYVETVVELISYLKQLPESMLVSNDYGEDLEVEMVGEVVEFR